jgi:hydroxyacylglutathione hydrolase
MEILHLTVGNLETNTYIIISGNEMAIIDPGADCDLILSEIAKLKNRGKKLKYIICTHYHSDHTADCQKIKSKTGAPILIHELEKSYIDFAADQFLKNGDIINIGTDVFKVLLTPGHSAGSICLLSGDKIFTGDTLFYGTYGRTDLAGGSEERMEESLEFLNTIIKPGMTVYPGHGEIFKYGI